VSQSGHEDGTVGKALNVLDLIATIGRPVRFTEVLSASDYPKATVYRLIQTLTNQGMLSYDSVRQEYSLGVRLVRLAHAAWTSTSIAPLARPYLDTLSQSVGETVHLAQLDNGQVLYVDKRTAHSPISMFSQAGKVGPGHCTGVGKAMIAFLPADTRDHAVAQQSFYAFTPHTITTADAFNAELDDIAQAGIAFDREEHEPEIICIAAPILASGGNIIGGISITSTLQRHSLQELEAFKPDLLSTAQKIAGAVEAWRFPDHTRKMSA
jgi:DNA-binding IclR family transcriptional regulator